MTTRTLHIALFVLFLLLMSILAYLYCWPVEVGIGDDVEIELPADFCDGLGAGGSHLD